MSDPRVGERMRASATTTRVGERMRASAEKTRVVLVSMANDVTCVGIRSLAAHLGARGVQAQVVYLPRAEDVAGWPWLSDLIALCAGAQLVGVSVMAIDLPRAARLSAALRRAGVGPVVWGGAAPTLQPEQCTPHADHVCVGDGEAFLDALLDGHAPPRPSPLATAAQVERAPRVALPDSYVLHEGRLEAAYPSVMERQLARNAASRDTFTLAYETVTSRGCPHACTFCGSTALADVQPGRYYRGRSIASILDELEEARRTFPGLTGMGFSDDNFLARPVRWIEAFSASYKARIGLPFLCLGSPATITPDRLRPLVDAGLRRIKMGIQTGSESVTRTFARVGLNRRVDAALSAIAAERDRILPPRFDLLVDLPFETDDDRIDTLALVARLPRPYRLELNSLRLMEGTPLYAQAQAEGWGTPDVAVDFKKIAPTWTNLVLAACRGGALPGPVVAALGRPELVRRLSRGWPAAVLRAVWGARRAVRG